MTIRRTIPILLAFLFAGCSIFSRQEKEYYSLETIAPAGVTAAAGGSPLGVDSFMLPPPIDRREIVVRQDDGQLDLRGTELWSAPLEAMVIHTLAFDLAERLPTGMVILPGQPQPAGSMRGVAVIAEKFEAGPESRLVLEARWTLRDADGSSSSFDEEIAIELESLDSARIASAMSEALAALADRIVAQIGG